jgi:predicted alpha/beta hydrolase family esterase
MTKRVFIVHGWGGSPNEAWMPWLDRELTAHGFQVSRLSMPHSDEPTIDDWVSTLAEAVGTLDEETHFIGHSIGVQTVLRYLAGLPESARLGKVVCVAGFFTLNLRSEDEAIAKPWLETPFNEERVRTVAPEIFALFSDDDPDVPRENQRFFEDRLGAKTIMEHGKGHFSEDSGVTELPAARDFLLE